MSVPDLTGDVSRAARVVVRGLTSDGALRELDVDAFEARAVLHELDHLDGLLFLDRVSSRHVFRRTVYR
jgi:peptide deformylase